MQVPRGNKTSPIENKHEYKLFSADPKARTASKTNKLLVVWNVIGFYGRFPVTCFTMETKNHLYTDRQWSWVIHQFITNNNRPFGCPITHILFTVIFYLQSPEQLLIQLSSFSNWETILTLISSNEHWNWIVNLLIQFLSFSSFFLQTIANNRLVHVSGKFCIHHWVVTYFTQIQTKKSKKSKNSN